MNLLIKFAGVVTLAGAAVVASAVVLGDETVRAKVALAADAIKDAALEIKRSVEDGVARAKQESEISSTEQNQAWVDEQWEALGI